MIPHITTTRAVNPPHNRTCGTCGKSAVSGIFFFYPINIENRNVFPKNESTLPLPIHTHKKDNHFGRVSSVCVLSRDHWSPVLLLLYGSPLARPAHVWCRCRHLGERTFLLFPRFFTFCFFREKKIVLASDCRGEG